MKILGSFVKPYRFAMIIALMLMFIELTVELYQPFIISKIIDDGIQQENLRVVTVWGSVLIGFSLLAFTAGIINSFYSAHASQSAGYDIRERLYEKVQSFSLVQLDRFSHATLITRMTNDVTQVQNMLFMILRIAMRAPLMVLGGVIMALLLDVKLALILVISVPILLVFVLFIMSKTGALFRSIQRRLDRVNNIMQENLIGMRLIKAFLRKAHEIKRFTTASEQLRDRTISALRLIELMMPLIMLLMNGAILLILWLGHHRLMSGGTSVGDIVAIINYALRITAALGMLSFIITHYARAKASAERIAEVIEVEEELSDTAGKRDARITSGHVRFQDVVFRYPEATTPTLQNITFTVNAGQSVAILGATGSGKTTLFQLIPYLYEAESGDIIIDGRSIRDIPFAQLRQKIGYVPQQAVLFSGTVRDNILWGKEEATEDEVIHAAKQAQIHETIMSFPQQYDTIIGQRGVNLSGGQKQRLSIARALVRKPIILLLDDSTSALDASTEAKLLHEIEQLQCTTMIITQKLSTAMKSDQIILLDDGRLLAQGNHHELWEQSDLYRKIYESQNGKGVMHNVN